MRKEEENENEMELNRRKEMWMFEIGDRWMVTRGMKYWLYGRRIGRNGQDIDMQPKGWFPRRHEEK